MRKFLVEAKTGVYLLYLPTSETSLSTATIDYSGPSVCLSVCVGVCVCVCVSVCVHDNSKIMVSYDLKLEHIVPNENSSDEFDIGHCLIKIRVTA